MAPIFPLPTAKRDTRRYPQTSEEFPRDLLAVGGVIGDLVRLCVDTAISPQPELALAAALCCVGAVAGRKYRTRTNLRTNLYVIGIADSGGGKDHARQIIKLALYEAGLKDYLGGEKIASGSALLSAVSSHPCKLFLLDEFGKFVKSVASAKASSHREEIWTNLTELYTSAGSIYLGSEYSDQKLRPRVDIEQPCCVVYGVTVPGAFWDALQTGALTDGSVARFLIVKTSDDYPDRAEQSEPIAISDRIIAGLQAVAAGYAGREAGNLPPMAENKPEPYIVPTTPEADILLRRLLSEQTDWLRSRRNTNDTAIIARYAENAAKVALIRAISDCPSDPIITAEIVAWSTKLVRHCVDTLLREAGRHVADNEQSANVKRVAEIIRSAGAAGIGSSDLTNRTPNLDKSVRGKIVADLVEGGKVDPRREATAGRPTTTYYWMQPTIH